MRPTICVSLPFGRLEVDVAVNEGCCTVQNHAAQCVYVVRRAVTPYLHTHLEPFGGSVKGYPQTFLVEGPQVLNESIADLSIRAELFICSDSKSAVTKRLKAALLRAYGALFYMQAEQLCHHEPLDDETLDTLFIFLDEVGIRPKDLYVPLPTAV